MWTVRWMPLSRAANSSASKSPSPWPESPAFPFSDEPEAGIDLWSFKNLIAVFEHLHEQNNGSIMIISHQERILNIADEIVVIANGQVANKGSRDEIYPQLLSGKP